MSLAVPTSSEFPTLAREGLVYLDTAATSQTVRPALEVIRTEPGVAESLGKTLCMGKSPRSASVRVTIASRAAKCGSANMSLAL